MIARIRSSRRREHAPRSRLRSGIDKERGDPRKRYGDADGKGAVTITTRGSDVSEVDELVPGPSRENECER